MLSFVLRRLGAAAVLLFLILTASFFVIHLAPGDPTSLLSDARITPERRAALYHFYGLDQPLIVQYGKWLSAALQGDWGISMSSGRKATELLGEKLPNTLLLALSVTLIEYLFGIAFGLLAAARADRAVDHGVRALSLLLIAMPGFWLALLGIEFLTVRWPLFPTNMMTSEGAANWPPLARALDILHHLALPALLLGLSRSAGVMRFVRNGVIEVLGQDYIRTARAKGLSESRILWRHALPNALSPLIQRLGLALPALLSGALIIEVIFAWPGIGQTVFLAIMERDYSLILASTALSGILVVMGSLLADILHAWVDPRVRHA